MKSEPVNPLWLRIWHGMQAFCFFALIATGLNMYYAGAPWAVIPFSTAVGIHNISGIATVVLWVIFVFFNVASGHLRHCIPEQFDFVRSLRTQLRYYCVGMFSGERDRV